MSERGANGVEGRRADGNLLAGAVPPASGERFETVRWVGEVQIERIVSSAAPEPGVYVQAQDEWVVVLRGGGTVVVDGQRVELEVGDHLFLPAGVAHSVERTEAGTVWLAVHVHPGGAAAAGSDG